MDVPNIHIIYNIYTIHIVHNIYIYDIYTYMYITNHSLMVFENQYSQQ